MHIPECSFPGKKKKNSVWDGMWKALIGLAILDIDRSVIRCRITSMEYQESVCFSNTAMLHRITSVIFPCSKLTVWTGFRH